MIKQESSCFKVSIMKTSTYLGKLKYSVPEFIKTDEELPNLVISIDGADVKDGGEGAILVKLKNL